MADRVDFTLAQGDRLPVMAATALLDGVPQQINGTSAVWRMSKVYDPAVLVTGSTAGGEVQVLDDGGAALKGRLNWSPKAGDLASPGLYRGQFTVTYPDGRPQRFPADRDYLVEVTPAV